MIKTARNAILYPKTAEESEKVVQNPLLKRGQDKDLHIIEGKKIYETFCIVCHGASGKGGGSISDKWGPPPGN